MKILVAEDDAISAHLIMKTLLGMGHEVICVADGQVALTQMVSDPCPVVISDWMMPGMDGISLCHAIRELRIPFYVYFILLTAKIPQGQGSRVLAHGVDAFLPKPPNRDTLRAKLNVAKSVLDNSQLRHVS